MEKNKYSKIITGCGIGCAVFVGIILLSVVGIYTYIQHTMNDVEEIEKLTEDIEIAYGKTEEFSPAFVEVNITERIESFLKIRDSLIFRAQPLIDAIKSVEIKKNNYEEEESFWSVLGIIGSGVGVIPHVVDYYYQRNDLLFENEMSLGEYYFHYITTYYSLLKKSPGDGPEFDLMSDSGNGIHLEETNGSNDDIETITEHREIEIRSRVNDLYSNFLKNFILNTPADMTTDFHQLVKVELEELKSDDLRIPWQDGLPVNLNIALEPYKVGLARSYSKLLNPFDFRNETENKK